jgi:hypothetical protein
MLNVKVYIYQHFNSHYNNLSVDQLLNYMKNNINVRFHTKYIPLGKKEEEVSDCVCGCLFHSHFSAILPWKMS